MKILVVYYSHDGSTKLMAETMALSINADLMELKTVKEIAGHGFMKYLWGGRQAMMKTEPELQTLDKNVDDYDLIIIGTPVWAWTFTPPIRSFFKLTKLTGKKVAIFCCHGGGMKTTLNQMADELVGNEIIGQIDFREPISHEREASITQAIEWAKKLSL